MNIFEKSCTVAVSGGGIAGIAAALQAARCGKKVILLEKSCVAGGLATNGLIYIYLPLCDGNGRQVIYGIAEELLHNSITLGPGEIPPNWQNEKNAVEPKRYRCTFSPASFMLTAEKLLLDCGVDIWYDTLVTDGYCSDNKVEYIEVCNESGKGRIYADTFIDASGSAVIARRANLPCIEGKNSMAAWALEYNSAAEQGAFGRYFDAFAVAMSAFDAESKVCMTEKIRNKYYRDMTDEKIAELTASSGADGRTVSEFVLENHRILRLRYELDRTDRNSLFPIKIANMPQIRKMYAVKGKYLLDSGDDEKSFADSIGVIGDWRKAGKIWEIPYRSLYAENGAENLLFAGRCISSVNDAWEATRVIPAAALTGQVTGLAAAMAHDKNVSAAALNVAELQNELRKQNIRIFKTDI